MDRPRIAIGIAIFFVLAVVSVVTVTTWWSVFRWVLGI